MSHTMTVLADSPETARALADWLRQESELRGTAITLVGPPPKPGEMGVLAETLQLVGDQSELLTAVATSVGVWLGTRVRRTRIRIRDGEREVEIDTGRPIRSPAETAQEILRQLRVDGDSDGRQPNGASGGGSDGRSGGGSDRNGTGP